jgi:hypothetical protein
VTAPALTVPDLAGFDTCYGVRISCIGDDGDMVMLGHVDRRRAIAAVRAYLRKLWMVQAEVDDHLTCHLGLDPGDAERAAERGFEFDAGIHRHAVVVEHCNRWPACQEPDADCGEPDSCTGLGGYDWYLKVDDVTPDTPGAFPITYWSE